MSLITNLIIIIIIFNVNTWALILDFWDMDPFKLGYLGYQDPLCDNITIYDKYA